MSYTVRTARRGDPREAALLADLWNASDAAWPGGLNQGVPMTPERMLERLERLDRLALFTVQAGEALIGYGDLSEIHGRQDAAYLPLILVRPDWQGRGCGKALLLAILNRTVELGYRQLSLTTWSGNLKAVPLYKRTGFFWQPGTNVRMQNFLPTILAMPLARGFFQRHDWYRSFRRELTLEPDSSGWQGTLVYPYRFEAGGERLTVLIDARTETPAAVETGEVHVASHMGGGPVFRGLEHRLVWKIVNKRGADQPLRATLSAQGTPGLELSVEESFEVRDSFTLERPFSVAPDLERPRPGMPRPGIQSTLIVDDVPVVLGTAVEAVQPIEIDVQGLGPAAGQEADVVVRLHNRLNVTARGEVSFEPRPGLEFDRLASPFDLPAGSWTSCRFRVTAGEGAHRTRVQAVCPPDLNPELGRAVPLETRAQPVTFHAVPLDRVYAWEDDEEEAVVIETPTFWVRARRRGGAFSVHERLSGRQVLSQSAPELDPAARQHVPPLHDSRLECDDGRVLFTLAVPSDTVPGLRVERTLTVGAGPYLRVDHRVFNGTGVEQRPTLRCATDLRLHRAVTVPLAGGLVHETLEGLGDFPLRGGRDLPKDPSAFSEGWYAREEGGLVAGLVWTDCAEVDEGAVRFDLPTLPPQSSRDVAPLYLVASRGGWEVVRGLWRRLQPEERSPETHPVLSAGFEPGPLLVTAPRGTAVLEVRNRRLKPFRGRWVLRAEGFGTEPAEGELAGVALEAPARRELTLTTGDLTPRVTLATVVLESAATREEREAPIVVLGDARRIVEVEPAGGGDRFAVDNGWMRFTVAPGHHGSIVSLTREGREMLVSSDPEPRPYHWTNAWFGGVEPFLGQPGDPRYLRDSFTGGPIERRGERGLAWRGVRAVCQVRLTPWLGFEVEFLTTGASNLIALVQRLTNRSGASQEIAAGFLVFPALTPATRVHYEVRRPERVRRWRAPTDHGFRFGDAPWVALETGPGSGLALISLPPPGEAGGWLLDRDSAGLQTSSPFRLEPGESRERTAWLAVTGDPRQAEAYGALGSLTQLP